MTLKLVKMPSIVAGEVIATIAGMGCDHAAGPGEWACVEKDLWAVVIFVPSRTQDAPGHRHLRLTHHGVHYCTKHRGEVRLDDLLNDRMKADFETAAKAIRPHDFRCDFDAAHITYCSIFEPEYFTFLKALAEARGAVFQKMGGMLVAR